MKIFIITSLLTVCSAAVEWEFRNNAGGQVWIGTQGNNGKPTIASGGFVLDRGQARIFSTEDTWAGRIWARTWCDPNTRHCQTGDCGNRLECNGAGGVPPVTLAEFTLRGAGGQDFYDLSLVDGYNIGLTIDPVGSSGGGNCRRIVCSANVNAECPARNRVIGGNGNDIIACKSDCEVTNSNRDCCRGEYNSPEKCPASESARYFKRKCPDAYSYAYDDKTSTFTCMNTKKYVITVVQ